MSKFIPHDSTYWFPPSQLRSQFQPMDSTLLLRSVVPEELHSQSHVRSQIHNDVKIRPVNHDDLIALIQSIQNEKSVFSLRKTKLDTGFNLSRASSILQSISLLNHLL